MPTHKLNPRRNVADYRAVKLVYSFLNLKGSHIPIFEQKGSNPPKLLGRPGVFFNREGREIEHPIAYGREGGYNDLVYRSSQRITVGTNWLIEQLGHDYKKQEAKRKRVYFPRIEEYTSLN